MQIAHSEKLLVILPNVFIQRLKKKKWWHNHVVKQFFPELSGEIKRVCVFTYSWCVLC